MILDKSLPPDWPLYLGTYFFLSVNFACAKCCFQCVNQARRGDACRSLLSPSMSATSIARFPSPSPWKFRSSPSACPLAPLLFTSQTSGIACPGALLWWSCWTNCGVCRMCHTQSHLHGPTAPERFLQASHFRVIRPTAMAYYQASSLSFLLLRYLLGSSPL